MNKLTTIELLELLFSSLKNKSDNGTLNSGKILENYGIKILNDLHGSSDPFGIYNNEYFVTHKCKSNQDNPLNIVIKRLVEELFSIVTTFRYPIILTPSLYVIYVSLLCELGKGELPSLFLDTYDGCIENFDTNFLPLMLEMYTRRSPMWGLVKNVKFCIENIHIMALKVIDNTRLMNEFKETKLIMNIRDAELKFTDLLPLFFTNIDSLCKGYKAGIYFPFYNKSKSSIKLMNYNNTNNNVDFKNSLSSAINMMLGVQIQRKKGSKNDNNIPICSSRNIKNESKLEYSSKNDNVCVLDNFSLCRMCISLVLKIFDCVGFSMNFRKELNNYLSKLEKSIVTIISGYYIDSESSNCLDNGLMNIELNDVYELDGSITRGIFTLENKVSEYNLFHYFHFQVVSGLRVLINGYNTIKNDISPGFYESIMLYIMRVLTQVSNIIESNSEFILNKKKVNSIHKSEIDHKYVSVEKRVGTMDNNIDKTKENGLNIAKSRIQKKSIDNSSNYIKYYNMHKYNNSSNQIHKFNSYTEIIPSEMLILINYIVDKEYSFKNTIRNMVFELHELQLKVNNNTTDLKTSSLFIISFIEYIKLKDKNELNNQVIEDSWKYIIEHYIYSNILNSYIIYLFCEMISDNDVLETINSIQVNLFINNYIGILIRVLVYHPDISYKSIVNMILNCIRISEKQELSNELYFFDNWISVTLMVICMPLMTLFPQRIESSISDVKELLLHIKPNNRVLSLFLKLIYPKANNNLKSELKSIISDLSVNVLLKSLYNTLNSSYNFGKKIQVRKEINEDLMTCETEDVEYNRQFFGNGFKLHTTIIIKKTLYFLDVLIVELMNYIDRLINISDNHFDKVDYFLSEILELFPYIFHQGELSLEFQERFTKLIINIVKKKPDLMFDNKIFVKIVNCLKIEVYTVVPSISPLCWVIGEIMLLKHKNDFLTVNEKNILIIVDLIKSILEKCYLNCTNIFNNILKNDTYQDEDEYINGNNNLSVYDANIDYREYNCNENEWYDSFSETYSSDSSFVSDSSIDIFKEKFDYDYDNKDNDELLNRDHTYMLNKYTNYSIDCNLSSKYYFEDINLNEYHKYIDYMYLVDTCISTILKIGIAFKQLKHDVIKIMELFKKKIFNFYIEENLFFNENTYFNYLYEFIQTSNIIVLKKIDKSIQILKHQSIFSFTPFENGGDLHFIDNMNNYPNNTFLYKSIDSIYGN